MSPDVAAPSMGETHRLWGGGAKCGATARGGLRPLLSGDPEQVTCERCLSIAAPGDAKEQAPLPL